MEGGNLNAAPAASGGIAFRRRTMAVNRVGRRQVLLLFGGVALFVAAIFLFLQYQISQLPHHPAAHHPVSHRGDFDLYMLGPLLVLAAIYSYLSSRYERLYVSPKGIRYQSFLRGPLASLQSFYPDWSLSWDELADIRLLNRAGGRNVQLWYYQLKPRQGDPRRILAAAWRLDGQADEIDLTLRQNLKRDPAVFKAAFAETRLFKLLDLTMRTRKGQFPDPLMQSE